MSFQGCSFGGEAVGTIKGDAWEAWPDVGACDGLEGGEDVLPILMGVCVWSLEPANEVAVVEIEAEEGYHHGMDAVWLDGPIVMWASWEGQVRNDRVMGAPSKFGVAAVCRVKEC